MELSSADREAILAILMRIGRKWAKGVGEGTGDMVETVVIPSGGKESLPGPASGAKEQDLRMETVLLSSRKASEEMVETVILTNDRKQGESRKEGGARKAHDDFFAETVILKTPPGEGKNGAKK